MTRVVICQLDGVSCGADSLNLRDGDAVYASVAYGRNLLDRVGAYVLVTVDGSCSSCLLGEKPDVTFRTRSGEYVALCVFSPVKFTQLSKRGCRVAFPSAIDNACQSGGDGSVLTREIFSASGGSVSAAA